MKKHILSVSILCFVLVYSIGQAQTVKYNVTEETTMTVSGTSTLHDWTSEVNEVKGFVEVDEKFAANGKIKKGEKINLVSINVPVLSIISPRGATMDKKTYAALKSEENPEIIFVLKDSKVSSVNGEVFSVDAQGDLTIAGVTKQVEFPVEGKLVSDGKMSFSGAYKLNMVDYEMEPPSAMFGQIVTGEEVEIKFELVVNK
jgi:polyisoprenoid-binding protein YceI